MLFAKQPENRKIDHDGSKTFLDSMNICKSLRPKMSLYKETRTKPFSEEGGTRRRKQERKNIEASKAWIGKKPKPKELLGGAWHLIEVQPT